MATLEKVKLMLYFQPPDLEALLKGYEQHLWVGRVNVEDEIGVTIVGATELAAASVEKDDNCT